METTGWQDLLKPLIIETSMIPQDSTWIIT